MDILEPTFSTLPYIRISPIPEASQRITEEQHRMPLDVRIQAAVGGSDFNQLSNFWAAIRSALFPTNPARRATVIGMINTANITRGQIIMNGYGWREEKETGLRMMVAQGTLQVVLLVLTM